MQNTSIPSTAASNPFSIGICPACHQSTVYSPDELVQHIDEIILTHGRCQHCGVSMFTLDIGRGSMRTSMSVLTDASAQDLDHLLESSPLNEQDVDAVKELVDQQSTIKYLLHNS